MVSIARSSAGEVLDEVQHQQWNIFRRSRSAGTQGKHFQAVEQIRTNLWPSTILPSPIGSGIRRASVRMVRSCQALKLPLLQHTQLSPAVRVGFRYFIEEYRSSIGKFKASDALRDSASEGRLSRAKSSLSSKPVGIAAQLS